MNWYVGKVYFFPLCPNVHSSPPPIFIKSLFISLIIFTDTSKYDYVVLSPPSPFITQTLFSVPRELFSILLKSPNKGETKHIS